MGKESKDKATKSRSTNSSGGKLQPTRNQWLRYGFTGAAVLAGVGALALTDTSTVLSQIPSFAKSASPSIPDTASSWLPFASTASNLASTYGSRLMDFGNASAQGLSSFGSQAYDAAGTGTQLLSTAASKFGTSASHAVIQGAGHAGAGASTIGSTAVSAGSRFLHVGKSYGTQSVKIATPYLSTAASATYGAASKVSKIAVNKVVTQATNPTSYLGFIAQKGQKLMGWKGEKDSQTDSKATITQPEGATSRAETATTVSQDGTISTSAGDADITKETVKNIIVDDEEMVLDKNPWVEPGSNNEGQTKLEHPTQISVIDETTAPSQTTTLEQMAESDDQKEVSQAVEAEGPEGKIEQVKYSEQSTRNS